MVLYNVKQVTRRRVAALPPKRQCRLHTSVNYVDSCTLRSTGWSDACGNVDDGAGTTLRLSNEEDAAATHLSRGTRKLCSTVSS